MASTLSPNFLSLVDVKLNGSNYEEWYSIVCITLLGLEPLGHVDGTSFPPKETDTLSAITSLFTVDHRTISFICQSYEDIYTEISHFPIILAIWDHLHHLFEESSYAHQYAILQDLTYVYQWECFVREYVTELQYSWRQLNSLEPSTCLMWKCCKARIQSCQT